MECIRCGTQGFYICNKCRLKDYENEQTNNRMGRGNGSSLQEETGSRNVRNGDGGSRNNGAVRLQDGSK